VTQPFLKWAGGKRWLVKRGLIPVPESYSRYIEPFLGSGAVFFALSPKRAILADSNADLVRAYRAIRSDWEQVERHILTHHRHHDRQYYYRMRSSCPSDLYEQAARFIYLNRTCWNGLYRVNLAGEFNVPIGTKTDVSLQTDDFSTIAKLLRRCRILCSDFEKVIDQADKSDFLYIDPPYTIKHGNNGFIKYNERLFQWQDQVRLRDSVLRARKRGAHVIISNAHHPSIRELYAEDFRLTSVSRFSPISGTTNGRAFGQEYLISGE
jgi:DNA adenine methylase